ncbi:hypothetical protein KHS38_15345 [Mucilaginibacter sp. Bleaf8]|uniref:hypothetical protein n=1 Tax=Mucilaginibacter sp. Bleaf8 TaxID=2834430 RepID=UPI001BCFC137|nr:hypothetical protein [Mucilaginibacter sp. Bleaf8]MBS7565782.1 hypothetical protein [Mucilaginibacter sp. Bleaf8]
MSSKKILQLILTIAIVLCIGCQRSKVKQVEQKNTESKGTVKVVHRRPRGTPNIVISDDTTIVVPPKETRIRFKNFTVVIHNFKGYESPYKENDSGEYSDHIDTSEYSFNETERSDADGNALPSYRETLIAKYDTVHLSEHVEETINNTLIEIVPNDKSESFKVTWRYLSSLNEVVDDNIHRSSKEWDKAYSKTVHYQEATKVIALKDSGKFFFRASPHTPDMVQIEVKNGKVVPVNFHNSKEQIDIEQRYWDEDMRRVRAKYRLKDTSVKLRDDYETEVTLAIGRKLFMYNYDAHLFRIDRIRNSKVVETKYLVVYISDGC